MRPGKTNCRGAFLLEALLAVFILSVALVGLIRGLLSSLNAAAEAEKYSHAILAADNALIEVIRLNGQKVEEPIVLEVQTESIAGQILVKPLEDPAIPEVLQQARLRVTWPGAVKNKTIEAVTLVFGSVDEKK